MKGNKISLITAAVLLLFGLGVVMYLGSVNRFLERHHGDLTLTSRDLTQRSAGCAAALADMDKFENHLDSYLKDREEEIARLKEQMAATCRRIGDVAEIREEFKQFETEMNTLKRILPSSEEEREKRR